jgi:hypothetical protein
MPVPHTAVAVCLVGCVLTVGARLPANAVCQRHLRHLTQRVRQQAGSYRSSLARHFAVRLLPSRLKPVPHTAGAVCLGGLKLVLRPHAVCLGVRLKTVGARLPANAVCQRQLNRLTQRVRQQAGAYRSSPGRHSAVRWLLPSRLKPVPHTADAFPAKAGPTYGGCGVSGRAEAGSAPACGVSGCTRTDCRSALARECGVSATFPSPDPARSPANRLLQMSGCHQCCSAAPDAFPAKANVQTSVIVTQRISFAARRMAVARRSTSMASAKSVPLPPFPCSA